MPLSYNPGLLVPACRLYSDLAMSGVVTALDRPLCTFLLVDSANKPIHTTARVVFERPGIEMSAGEVSFKGAPISFDLSNIPTGQIVVCVITTPRHRPIKSKPMVMNPALNRRENIALMRDPGKWKPSFTLWTGLDPIFAGLKALLTKSTGLRLLKAPVELGTFTEAAYDDAAGNKAEVVLAKTSLLNLYWALTTLKEPIAGERTWMSFVERILFIDRERFVAVVDRQMHTVVREIHTRIEEFRDAYRRTPDGDHSKNLPPEARSKLEDLVSIKTLDDRGNVQLTLAALNDGTAILDADMDENGRAIAHFFDAFLVHRFTGGTHPIDIHECIRMRAADVDLGYSLV
jgi:hypothetical protein